MEVQAQGGEEEEEEEALTNTAYVGVSCEVLPALT